MKLKNKKIDLQTAKLVKIKIMRIFHIHKKTSESLVN
jgi:hypothetical protein